MNNPATFYIRAVNVTPKILDIEKGGIMVSADLHGHWKDYVQVMQTFKTLRKEGRAKQLVFLGDLLHAPEGKEDNSVEILDDLIRRGLNEPGGKYYCILGNHEMVHIYHIDLWKGNQCFTQGFEDRIADNRAHYVEALMGMPFAIRSAGGALMIHAGAGRMTGSKGERPLRLSFEELRDWDHHTLVALNADKVGVSRKLIWSEYDPHIGMAFKDSPHGQYMWEFLMNKNERQYGMDYEGYLRRTLKLFSHERDRKLNVMISGHMGVRDGAEIVELNQLRLSTSKGAGSRKQKKYLLFDAAERLHDGFDLKVHCHPLYAE